MRETSSGLPQRHEVEILCRLPIQLQRALLCHRAWQAASAGAGCLRRGAVAGLLQDLLCALDKHKLLHASFMQPGTQSRKLLGSADAARGPEGIGSCAAPAVQQGPGGKQASKQGQGCERTRSRVPGFELLFTGMPISRPLCISADKVGSLGGGKPSCCKALQRCLPLAGCGQLLAGAAEHKRDAVQTDSTVCEQVLHAAPAHFGCCARLYFRIWWRRPPVGERAGCYWERCSLKQAPCVCLIAACKEGQ